MRQRFFLGLVLVLLVLGCNNRPYQVAEVSGKVTLDGKALPKAYITFVPMATQQNQAPGPTAQAMTDENGHYKLTVDPSTSGSVVGKCRVFITTVHSEGPNDDRDAGGPVAKVSRERVPEKYNMKTELVFDVPAGGTDKANFDLKSRERQPQVVSPFRVSSSRSA